MAVQSEQKQKKKFKEETLKSKHVPKTKFVF